MAATKDLTAGRGMARKHEQRNPFTQPRPVPAAVVAPPPVVPILEEFAKTERVESYRQCPLCWGRCKGVGLVYSTQGNVRYYKCKRTLTEHPPCGFCWTAKVEIVKVEYRAVTIDGQR